MDFQTIMQALQDITGHKWMPLAILVIGYLVTLTSDTSKFPVNIPDKWKPVVAIVLGEVYSTLIAISDGTNWKAAVWHGLVTAMATSGLFDLVINGFFNGNLPKWLKWIAFIDPKLISAKEKGTLVAPAVGKARDSSAPPPMPPPPPAPKAA
jgi:hypothetical protein